MNLTYPPQCIIKCNVGLPMRYHNLIRNPIMNRIRPEPENSHNGLCGVLVFKGNLVTKVVFLEKAEIQFF